VVPIFASSGAISSVSPSPPPIPDVMNLSRPTTSH
jgi:hypothetical protein